jgi:hypothetical protein
VRGFKHLASEALWRLRGVQLRAVHGCSNPTVWSDALDRLGQWQHGHDRIVPCAYGLDDRLDERDRDERPGCIMHEHDIDGWRQCREGEAYRCRSRLRTGHHEVRVVQ